MIYILYIIILILFAFSYDFRSNKENVTSWQIPYIFVCFAFIWLAAFRDQIGGDTIVYMNTWKKVPELADLTHTYLEHSRYQRGFNFFFSAAKSISRNFIIFQILHAIVINWIIFWFVAKMTKFRFTTILLFFILNYLEFNTEILRESIAVCCGLLSFYNFSREYRFRGWFFIFLAFSFHISAIVLLCLPLATKIRYSNKVFGIFLGIIIFFLVLFPLIPDVTPILALLTNDAETLMQNYDIREINSNLNIKFYILFSFKCIIIPFTALKLIKNKCDRYIGLALIYVLFYSMSCFSYGFYRFANYFALFYTIFLSTALIDFIKRIKGDSIIRITIYISLICCFTYLVDGYLLGKNITTGEPLYARYFPYKTQFFDILIGNEE